MSSFRGTFYDGKVSRGHPCEVYFTPDQVLVKTSAESIHRYDTKSLRFPSPIGKSIRVIEGTDGSRLELYATTELDNILYASKSSGWLHKIEGNYQSVFISVIAFLALIFWLYSYGIPMAADKIAPAVPPWVPEYIGQETVKTLHKYEVLKESRLEVERQADLLQALSSLNLPEMRMTIEFGFIDFKEPNAFALPNGQIYFTDTLVKILPTDEHLISVAWHEVGHIYHEHSLKLLIQNSALGLLFFAITGGGFDVSTLPMIVMTSSYSQAAETEADFFAAKHMVKNGLAPSLLAESLQLIEDHSRKRHNTHENDEKAKQMTHFLSTHPLTEKRIEFLNSFEN